MQPEPYTQTLYPVPKPYTQTLYPDPIPETYTQYSLMAAVLCKEPCDMPGLNKNTAEMRKLVEVGLSLKFEVWEQE